MTEKNLLGNYGGKVKRRDGKIYDGIFLVYYTTKFSGIPNEGDDALEIKWFSIDSILSGNNELKFEHNSQIYKLRQNIKKSIIDFLKKN